MGIRLGRVGHIGIHVSDADRSIDFYRKVLGLKLTGRWGPPTFGRQICFMRIDDKHHDVVLFELSEDARKAGGKVLCGGKRNGAMLEATLMENVPTDSKANRMEAFGPPAEIPNRFEA